MCGITGWVSYDRDLTREHEVIHEMTATMANRGPDASGTWVRRHVALGHRRLAVIDLAGGAQPMTVETAGGAVAMVYSGEAYNFKELRAELQSRGYRFRTSSDTEVVLRGYLEWGDNIAERLNGMYALAIWDERDNKLVLIRDRMGIKPLYYHRTNDGVLFGSEPKAILAHGLLEPAVDAAGLRRMLAPIGLTGGSPWKGIEQVEPGTVLTVRPSGISERTYWRLPTRPHQDDRQTTVERVRELLTDCVSRQLVSDVPLGVLLSGGLDSSSIAALAASQLRAHEEQVRTFSVDFANLAENFAPNNMVRGLDTPYAAEVATLVRSEHQIVTLDPARMDDRDLRRAVVAARDMPGLGELDASLYLLFASIRKRATVALSGESADELFGGYFWFHDEAARAFDGFPWLVTSRDHSLGRYRSLGRSPIRAEHLRRAELPAFVAEQYAEAAATVEYLEDESPEDRRMRRMSHLCMTRYVREWLDRKDRMSMAVGLEVRVPFCDNHLVEYVYNVPWSLKTFDGREKSILRHAMKDKLPASVVGRVKSGYPSSHDPMYTAALQQRAKEVLAGEDDAVFAVVDRSWMEEASRCDPSDAPAMLSEEINWVLDLHDLFELYRPTLALD
ncbi:asparagine synthase (glutamine-hydrolyzing) [Kribbella jejuensis]|uniref:asparagine synthase (glutamine-hydrolyzing) n=1 Tax=Kribbella jejuensis TaxID=236068 RepID=A0A542ES18_9ACTN|nr:asparagine synthase (glutamine-hydrolyzing) [Kribbella jejuensis]TQJ18034.1 asparagine synthase (glutamine-hydrolysing) [Kribbella jejuensis]